MTGTGLSNQDLAYIINAFRAYPDIKEVWLFGSRAKGTYRIASDIDLAIKGNVPESVILNLNGTLNDEGPLPYKLDIIHYESINNPNLKDHIDRVGIKLYPEA